MECVDTYVGVHVGELGVERRRRGRPHGPRTTLRLRSESVLHGWREVFEDRYLHAGGPQHTALFIENGEGFELELVAD